MDMDRTACYRAISTRDARFDGRLFVGVKTTGIYCRPICPARTPKFENVSFYPSAAAAQEAGFRPCLRCRPETSPDLAFWRGTSNTVSRALALIEAGGLDEADVEGLANRLGVGARQLRRLFRQHVGASPIAVAQTRRVLLAKQLIHETSLPMAEVALASGFNSVRRFNETFLQLFGRSPATLRRARDKTRREAGALSVRLAYRPPYDWDAMLSFLAARAIPGVEIVSDNIYRRTIAIGDDQRRDQRRAGGPKPDQRLGAISRYGGAATDHRAGAAGVRSRRRSRYDRRASFARPGAGAAGRGAAGPARARRMGWLRTRGARDLRPADHRSGRDQIARQAGAGPWRAAAGGDEGRRRSQLICFRRPRVLPTADLAALGMPNARAMSVTSLAQAIAADPAIFSRGASLEDAIAKLRSLPGIGEWTAQYIAMRELREPDAFPAADIGLLRAMTAADGRRPSPAGTAVARRAMAAVARLCRVASVGRRHCGIRPHPEKSHEREAA